jgi:hypothetical protein
MTMFGLPLAAAALERKPETGKAATAPDGAMQRAEASWCLIILPIFLEENRQNGGLARAEKD